MTNLWVCLRFIKTSLFLQRQTACVWKAQVSSGSHFRWLLLMIDYIFLTRMKLKKLSKTTFFRWVSNVFHVSSTVTASLSNHLSLKVEIWQEFAPCLVVLQTSVHGTVAQWSWEEKPPVVQVRLIKIILIKALKGNRTFMSISVKTCSDPTFSSLKLQLR